MLSWEYAEKTVHVESLAGNVPVIFTPDEYVSTGQPITLAINCPSTGYQSVTVNTTEVEETVSCHQKPLQYTLTFSSAGEQSVLITTFNNISSSDETYSVIVQDEVDVAFSVVSSGISPNVSVAVGTAVSFVADAVVPFTPQPDLLVSWNVSGELASSHELLSENDIVRISSVSYLFSEVCHHLLIYCSSGS